jgi:hypothetical protein
MGQGYTLLRFDPKVEVKNLVAAAERRGVPLQVLDVESDEAASVYDYALVLSRPDQHIAWRGQREPADAPALIDLIRGARVKERLDCGPLVPARAETQAGFPLARE